MRNVNQLVSDAIQRWIDLSGYDRSKRSFLLGREKFGGMDERTIRVETEALCESRVYDPTGLTTFMMVRGLVEEALKNEAVSAYDLILAPAKVEERIAPMRAVRDLLEDEDVVAIVDEFTGRLREAAERYGWKGPNGAREEFEVLLADRYALAMIRRDALKSLENLEVSQFTQGDGDPTPPGISPHVWEFWNINSVLRAMRAQKVPGISVVLLRDPEEALQSFFVVAFRNGDNITVLTDRDRQAHPMQRYMVRRPDRDLERRAEQHWFPYQLLDLRPTEDQKKLYAAARTSLVPVDAEGVKLKPIAELHAEQFVWLVLLAELVRERFWAENHHVPALSYTGEMVRVPEALAGASGSLVASGAYQLLDLPPVTEADVSPEAMRAQWAHEPTGKNRWITERYAAEVPATALNPVGEAEVKLLEEGLEHLRPEPERFAFVRVGVDDGRSLGIRALAPTSFGTREDLQRDRTWTARYNQAKVVNELARQEFDREKKKVVDWYAGAVEANADAILRAAAAGSMMLPSSRYKGGFDSKLTEEPLEALAWAVGRTFYSAFNDASKREEGKVASGAYVSDLILSTDWNGDVVLGPWRGKHHGCWHCGAAATVLAIVVPTCPGALAAIVGKRVEDLPWPLQHWYRDEPYDGNSILQRIDPEEWVIENPWRKLHLRVGVALCRTAVNELRKKMGLPKRAW